MIEKHQFIPMEQDPTCCAYFGCALGASNDVHDVEYFDDGCVHGAEKDECVHCSVNAEKSAVAASIDIPKDNSESASLAREIYDALAVNNDVNTRHKDGILQMLTGIIYAARSEPCCWHCGVVLAVKPIFRCEQCPDECDLVGCTAWGCSSSIQAAASPKAGLSTTVPAHGPASDPDSESVSSDTPASPSQLDRAGLERQPSCVRCKHEKEVNEHGYCQHAVQLAGQGRAEWPCGCKCEFGLERQEQGQPPERIWIDGSNGTQLWFRSKPLDSPVEYVRANMVAPLTEEQQINEGVLDAFRADPRYQRGGKQHND